MTPDNETYGRLRAANSLLTTTPYKPKLYFAGMQLHLFIERMGTGFANVDIAVHINYGNGYLMRGPRSIKRANLPWGGTQERMVVSVCTWVIEGSADPWREGWWERMVTEQLVGSEAVQRFLAASKPDADSPVRAGEGKDGK